MWIHGTEKIVTF